MEKSVEGKGQGVGRCRFSFWFAVFHDILGLAILLCGVFWDVFFNDLLIYSGAVVIFLSLIWWVFWYVGNIEVPPAELDEDPTLFKKSKGISQMVRKVSSRLSDRIRRSFRKSGRSRTNAGGTGDICMISYTESRPPSGSDRTPLSI